MPNTTNFNFPTPADTDLVKDGALAIRNLGNSIDTAFVDLKGGTTGQVLSKNSNTDLDYAWVAQDDSNAIQNALLTTTGDTIYASGASTPARLGIGSTGQVLTVAGGLPSWATPTSGGMTLINTGGTTLTGASITISSIPSTYRDLQLIIRNFKPATDAEVLVMRFNGDTATRYKDLVAGSTGESFTQTSIQLSAGNDNSVANGLITSTIYDYANTDTWKMENHYGFTVNQSVTTNFNYRIISGFYNQTAAISSITLLASTGNLTSGTAFLYGVR